MNISYCIGESIVLPYVRYVDIGKHKGMMFHTVLIKVNGKFKTLGCNKMDVSGLCSGHKMSKKEFLRKYCNGIEPKSITKN